MGHPERTQFIEWGSNKSNNESHFQEHNKKLDSMKSIHGAQWKI